MLFAGIFNLFKSTDAKYKACVRSRRSNLLQNSQLRKDVLTATVAPDRLAVMTNQVRFTGYFLFIRIAGRC